MYTVVYIYIYIYQQLKVIQQTRIILNPSPHLGLSKNWQIYSQLLFKHDDQPLNLEFQAIIFSDIEESGFLLRYR